ncbi:histidinol-phosphatase [Helicobacter mustelae]|uniref:histidinol-phosphatase n=1 Tax=Helicobacter mustelae TaxID=217 RepID=UPI000DF9ADAF|nr:histidinol-phosphatase [Helicobacter mustelae]STP13085.1 histidinol-phosphatase [Helicobacter mustelae]
MMRVDLHNHTPRCKHASGTPEEYVQKAIAKKIDVFGFSCHNPMDFDRDYRMGICEFQDYCAEILALKEKYQGQIEVLLGLEVDFFPARKELVPKEIFSARLDYLIGSVHFLGDWGFDNPEFMGEYKKRDMLQCWQEYLDAIAQMAQSGLFQVVGHLDLLKVFHHQPPPEVWDKIASTLHAIAANGLALEINASGLRKPIAEQYPSLEILRLAHELGVEITFGSDAHQIEHIGYGYEICLDLAYQAGYKQGVFFVQKQKQIYEF